MWEALTWAGGAEGERIGTVLREEGLSTATCRPWRSHWGPPGGQCTEVPRPKEESWGLALPSPWAERIQRERSRVVLVTSMCNPLSGYICAPQERPLVPSDTSLAPVPAPAKPEAVAPGGKRRRKSQCQTWSPRQGQNQGRNAYLCMKFSVLMPTQAGPFNYGNGWFLKWDLFGDLENPEDFLLLPVTKSLDWPAVCPSIGEWTAYRSTEQIRTHQTRLTKQFSDCASSDFARSLSCWISLYHWVSFHFLARELDLASVPKSREKLTVGMCTSSWPGLSISKEQLHKLPSQCVLRPWITRISGSVGTAHISTISWTSDLTT